MKKYISVLLAAFASTVAVGAEVSKEDFEYATIISFRSVSTEKNVHEKSKTQRTIDRNSQELCGLEFSELATDLIYGKSNKSKNSDQIAPELSQIEKSDLSKECQNIIKDNFTKVIENVMALVQAPAKLRTEIAKANREMEKSEKSKISKKTFSMDVIGLVPDISKEADVSPLANSDDVFCSPFCLRIGGHNLQCQADYHENGTLSLLTCWFGMDTSKSDNIAIFNTLEAGFSAKFGKPKTRLKRQVQNSFGANFEVINPKWIDDSGNILEMASRANRVDTGAFALKSVILRAQEAVEAKKNEADRKF